MAASFAARSKTGKAQCEQMFSGLPQKANIGGMRGWRAFIPICADCVEKLESRGAPKIAQCSALAILATARLCRLDTSASDRFC
jgi:hypothetical protein